MNTSCNTPNFKARCLKISLLAIAGIAALGAVVMLLWNWLIPAVFVGAQPVSYLQALGILLLSKILFGGFHGRCHGRWRERHQHWENISPEEREKLRSHFHGRWGQWCGTGKPDSRDAKDVTPNAD